MLETILCIDDDPITLMLCKMVIKKALFSNEIATAKNGEEAIKHFDNLKTNHSINKPQLIFLDLNMPVMNGWEFLERFITEEYSEYHDTKVIILSSTIDPQDLEKSKKYPMVIDFLSKPISKEMLEFLKNKI
ncbi:response regulator [Flavobacterium franklandianum]|uniref:Response regulator n=1 Tax=Flavobacterium franklandianum TaxID=2594430 RepID=A0A553C5M5_9FLAO|nr:response regulator [Flavobacterium franklandianum]TRX15840.1 response regulator [Flavobacterium franklandianum]TRX21792.1 response regulator [Flavobacterium franklandianum]